MSAHSDRAKGRCRSPNGFQAVLLDKDGTLLDFHRTWSPAMGKALRTAAKSRLDTIAAADLLRFDLGNGVILLDSPFIAAPNDVIESLVESKLDIECYRRIRAAAEPVVAPGAAQALHALSEAGFVLALVTNAPMEPSHEQLSTLGWNRYFGAIITSDSGSGVKPSPEPIEQALRTVDVAPAQAIMVGDTSYDLVAARRASVASVLVTNSQQPVREAAELADVIIATLRELLAVVCNPARNPR